MRAFAETTHDNMFTNAAFKAIEKIVDGSSSSFERGKLCVRWIFVDVFLELKFGLSRFFDRAVHHFELLLERLHARINGGTKVCCMQISKALDLVIATQ